MVVNHRMMYNPQSGTPVRLLSYFTCIIHIVTHSLGTLYAHSQAFITHRLSQDYGHVWLKKGKGGFYIVSSPLDRSKRFTLFALPDIPVHSDTNPASPGNILARQQLRAKTKSLTFPPLYITRYSFIQLSQQGRQWRERKCPIFETVGKGDLNPGSLDCESGVLPLSYPASQSYSVILV